MSMRFHSKGKVYDIVDTKTENEIKLQFNDDWSGKKTKTASYCHQIIIHPPERISVKKK